MQAQINAFDLYVICRSSLHDWQDPKSVENVISTPCDPATHGAMLASSQKSQFSLQ